jgi:hypothetical protein
VDHPTTTPSVVNDAALEVRTDRLRAAWARVNRETPGPARAARLRAIERRARLLRYVAGQLAEFASDQVPTDMDELARDITWEAAVSRLVIALGPDGQFVIGAQLDPTEKQVADDFTNRLARDPGLAELVRARLEDLPPLVAGVRVMTLADLVAVVGLRMCGPGGSA